MPNPVQSADSFKCLNCGREVKNLNLIGSRNRNHCPYCLWSKHVDLNIAGDRLAGCQSLMQPIGLTFKQINPDKYKPDQGELMLIHHCQNPACGKISLNRIAGDDNPNKIFSIFKKSWLLPAKSKLQLQKSKITLAGETDFSLIKTQLWGKEF